MRWWGWLLQVVFAGALCAAVDYVRLEAQGRGSSSVVIWLEWLSVPIWLYAVAVVWGAFILVLRKSWSRAEKLLLQLIRVTVGSHRT